MGQALGTANMPHGSAKGGQPQAVQKVYPNPTKNGTDWKPKKGYFLAFLVAKITFFAPKGGTVSTSIFGMLSEDVTSRSRLRPLADRHFLAQTHLAPWSDDGAGAKGSSASSHEATKPKPWLDKPHQAKSLASAGKEENKEWPRAKPSDKKWYLTTSAFRIHTEISYFYSAGGWVRATKSWHKSGKAPGSDLTVLGDDGMLTDIIRTYNYIVLMFLAVIERRRKRNRCPRKITGKLRLEPKPSQALLDGLGLGLRKVKPKPAQAKSKPGLPS
ncbi:hypothetical protein B0H14DRAFT_2558660 [Mycena olivaceomarginata]|nr:hypothetical protein B0H14DRAFT_2558660 [Mycena olivaceomarginata]